MNANSGQRTGGSSSDAVSISGSRRDGYGGGDAVGGGETLTEGGVIPNRPSRSTQRAMSTADRMRIPAEAPVTRAAMRMRDERFIAPSVESAGQS
jgi:hypothetical protein